MGAEIINYAEYLDIEPEESESGLEGLIQDFDQNWRREGLPRDWYNFGKAGFSMKSQMNLLEGLDADSKAIWINRTEQDMRGFVVEYLRQDLVHPVFYRKENIGGKAVLIDDKYDKGITDTVSPQERNGAVATSLEEIQAHLDGEGSAAIMISPRGWTGLETDSGDAIEYPDSWIFNFVDHGDHVVGFGVKTDFSLVDCRNAIAKLTGNVLPPDSSVEDYVRAVAKIDPGAGIRSPQDFMRVLRKLRNGQNVYKDRGWNEVGSGVNRLEEINKQEAEVEEYIKEFREFAAQDHTKFELQEALAATLYRISAIHIENRSANGVRSENKVVWFSQYQNLPMSYGQVLEEVEKIPGCAGGGQKSSLVDSIVERMGVSDGFSLPEDKYGKREVKCPSCGETVIRPKDTLVKECNHCGSNKISCK